MISGCIKSPAFWVSLVAALAVCAGVAWPFLPRRVTGRSIVETLNNPVAVKSWSGRKLSLADGREVRVPGIKSLHGSECLALREAFKNGVEIGFGGTLTVLVKVNHSCGNDPVWRHLARVNLTRFVVFTGSGVPETPMAEAPPVTPASCSEGFCEWGWDVSPYSQFRSWCAWIDAPRASSGK